MLTALLMTVAAVREQVLVFVEFVRTGGALGLVAFCGAMFLAGTVALPIWLPGVIAGYAFGFGKGLAVGGAGVLLHFVAAFVLGRYALRGPVRKRITRWKNWPRIEVALERAGLRLIGLLRATPVLPQNFLGYALGTTSVPLRTYVVGTVGIIPMLVLHVYAGSTVARVEEIFESAGNAWTAAAGVVVSVVAVWLVTRTASRVLRESLDEHVVDEGEAQEPPSDP